MTLGNPRVDLFSLDIEGAEYPVLKTVPWDKVNIRCLIIEVNHAGTIFEGNQFQIIGRADFVVNSGGLKIHPEIVRKLISAHLPPEINDFELLGCPDDILGEKLAMVIFTKKEELKGLADPENWFNAISNPTERRTLPRSIYLMEDIRPILAGGKTDFMFLRKKIEEIVPVWEKPKTKE